MHKHVKGLAKPLKYFAKGPMKPINPFRSIEKWAILWDFDKLQIVVKLLSRKWERKGDNQ
jgi:hypothetical protein